MARHRLGVVAGRHGDHAARARSASRQQRQPVGRAAFLEGAGRLQVLELQQDLGAGGAARSRRSGSVGVRRTRPAMRAGRRWTSARVIMRPIGHAVSRT